MLDILRIVKGGGNAACSPLTTQYNERGRKAKKLPVEQPPSPPQRTGAASRFPRSQRERGTGGRVGEATRFFAASMVAGGAGA